MDYEQNVKELENIIQKLESGDVKFDEATKLFEKGAIICKELSKTFDAAKGKVTVLREELMGLLKEEEMN
ncbi:MAG: exodeoxyribonuclease VII small subunit [Eubacteriales bacterium]|nr:exodeoxyribonuclease VII small subunit [Eubacteriales bacterium]